MKGKTAGALRSCIRTIDETMRRKQGIFDYNTNPGCMFRASVHRLTEPIVAPGTFVPKGVKMLELHFRSEYVPPLPPEGPDLAYARKLIRMATKSFQMLADYLANDPLAGDIRVIGGKTNFLFSGNIQSGTQVLSRMGVGIAEHRSAAGVFERFFTDLYAWLLMWTYNPNVLRARKGLDIEWYWFWIGRDDLLARYKGAGS